MDTEKRGRAILKEKKVFDDLKNIRSFRPSCALQTQCRLKRIGDRTSGLGGISILTIKFTLLCLSELTELICV